MFKMWFQELLNECIDIQEHKQQLEKDKIILNIMKENLKELAQSGKRN